MLHGMFSADADAVGASLPIAHIFSPLQVPMGFVNLKRMANIAKHYRSRFTTVVGIQPTGWKHSSSECFVSCIASRTRGTCLNKVSTTQTPPLPIIHDLLVPLTTGQRLSLRFVFLQVVPRLLALVVPAGS